MRNTLLASAAAGFLAGCAALGTGSGDGPRAVASLQPTQGNSARGSATFVQRGDKVRVSVQVSGLKPGAEHGFHVHEKGDCSAPDATSAGGHFNPGGKAHGHYSGGDRHAGDLPNLKADASGNASATFEAPGISVGTGGAGITGRGLVIHRDPDDYKSQPAGNSGPRIACGVIR